MVKKVTCQRGLTLTGMLLVTTLVVVVGILGMKVVPELIQYWKVLRVIKAVAQDNDVRGGTVADVRAAFDRRANIDQIDAVTFKDIDVTKEGNNLVLSFAYTKRIPLVGPVSLLIDFEGSSSR